MSHTPPTSPLVEALLKVDEETGERLDDTEEVMALVGFVGPGRGDDVRLYPDLDFQRWMDFPPDDIVRSEPLAVDSTGVDGRTVVWIQREKMFEPVFREDALVDFREDFAGSWMSTWPLIPRNRYVAAQMLDLLPYHPAPIVKEGGSEV